MSQFNVKKVAVLGAGVMGAQIAAHLVNCKVPVILFDLPAKEGPKNAIALKAIDNLKKLKPAPLALADDAALIEVANYDDDLKKLKGCDLIIEAIAERMDWKSELYAKIAPHVAKHAILASNTSGLSITKLSEALPEALRPRFCGIHFFNPPRDMLLVELIATPTTQAPVLDQLESFVTSALGKGVVRAKDTPNFVANRVGIGGMLATLKEVEKYGLTFDVVDDLTGKRLGRASSGTFRTIDVVGLDTVGHVIKTLQDNLDAQSDSFYGSFATPTTQPQVLDQLEGFVTSALGKGVVRAKDTPNFVANRIGIAGLLATMKEAEKFGLNFDVVDDLTGKRLGRASSGTFRTADVVGLDTMAHVIKTLQDNLNEQSDPFYGR